MKDVKVIDWGLIDYQKAWDAQTSLHKELVDQMRSLRAGEIEEKTIPHKLVLCEHPHVYTLGKSGKMDNLLWNSDQLNNQGVQFYKINRGGDITYHGPGQVVVYPILDLDEFYNDVHRYVRSLEEVVIRVLYDYGIVGNRIDGFTGVWLHDNHTDKFRKICAIGVHLSRWVSMHGLAFNINNDLTYFEGIVPCGIRADRKEVTTLSDELGCKLDIVEVRLKIKNQFKNVFKIEYIE